MVGAIGLLILWKCFLQDFLISTGAKLVAPSLYPEEKWQQGYDWVIELLRMDYDVIASEMMIVKALKYLKYKHFDKVSIDNSQL